MSDGISKTFTKSENQKSLTDSIHTDKMTFADFMDKIQAAKGLGKTPEGDLPWVEVPLELFDYIRRGAKADGSMIYNDVEVFVTGRRDEILKERHKTIHEKMHGYR